MNRVVLALLFALAGPRLFAAVDFDSEVKPILSRSCYGCHSASVASAGLRLDSRTEALKVVTPGNSAGSRLIERVTNPDSGKRMPLGGKPLTDAQIATLRKWIDEGATWSANGGPKKHWAYVKPVRPPLPAVSNSAWVRNPIDQFVLARLDKEGLTPSPEASKETLIRRVTIDLTGLPPTLSEIDHFLADQRPDAYRSSGGPAPRIPAFRRTVGPAMARSGALRRHQRVRKGSTPHHVALSRLGDQRSEPRHAL